MKKVVKSMICATLALCCVSAMAGCAGSCSKGGDMLTQEPNVGITQGVSESIGKYSTVAYYELERPDDVRIPFEADKIQKISFKYRVLSSGEYSYKNDTIIIKKSVFANETAGDKRVRVFVDGQYVEVTVRVVSKVIYTTEDFNSIRTNMNGVFVLGADIDFGGEKFWPIGKSIEYTHTVNTEGKDVYDYKPDSTFEGIFDGMGYSIKNLVLDAYDNRIGEDEFNQGPSLNQNKVENDRNYNNGIFMKTGGSAQIINTNFVNITVNCQGLSGAVVGGNGGIIKNCRVTCNLTHHAAWYEKSAGIAGVNGSNDAAGRIENCIVVYSTGGGSRGIVDWNSAGIIKNCYAAVADDYVFHIAYDSETKSVPTDFDYDDWVTQENYSKFFENYTIPAFPGAMDTSKGIFYKGGDIIKSDVVTKEFLLNPANFSEEDGWDRSIWNFTYGAYPCVKVQSK
ncbi:MAG: hypothetical protein HDP34_04965 [Clostridia bacterium]|nr:hypothetical protein [Clostridia bacterium]